MSALILANLYFKLKNFLSNIVKILEFFGISWINVDKLELLKYGNKNIIFE